MCWSASASIAATAIGGVATAYSAKKKMPKVRTFTLAFFTLMELLQAISYIWIDQCDMSGNILLTHISYIHIALQIPVANLFMLSFVSEKNRKKWLKIVMAISAIASFLMLLRWFGPLIWVLPRELLCNMNDALCGVEACTYRGNWHLAWRLPLMGFDPHALLYFVPVFILPLLYGAWRLSLYHFLFGPFLAFLSTTDRNEAPAIWCLFSIAILGAIFFRPLRKWLETPM
ncbi:MAG: hypothetical protein UZ21_OP11001000818 [Microgenomates bacterium OLB22]|nr:MAG: hypothetical protein UZ21_OP11001000818 [Microgenomates bacterium OLB22]